MLKASLGCSHPSETITRCIRNLHILQDSRKRLGGHVDSWQGFWCSFFMKLSGKPLLDVLFHLRPSPGASGTSTSSKTPGRDLEDRWSLDRLSHVQSSWNFQGSFFWMLLSILDHHQVHQEPLRPPRLQEETRRTVGVLTGFLMSNLHETFREASLGCSHPSETITRCVRNIHVLKDSWKKLGGQVKSWPSSWGPIFIKLSWK